MPDNNDTQLTMRQLQPMDTFSMMRILAQMRVKDVLVTLFKRWQEINQMQLKRRAAGEADAKAVADAEADVQAVGMGVVAELIEVLMGNLYLAQDDINRLLAQLCGVPVAQIESLDFNAYNLLLGEFLAKRELKDFFTSILSSKAFQNLR